MSQRPIASKIITGYFLLQALAVALWWGMLVCFEETVGWFHPSVWDTAAFYAFGLPDFLLLILGSCVAAGATWKSMRWAPVAVWSIGIAAWYPTLYCLAASLTTGEAWFATSCMVCMAGLCLVMATMIGTEAQSAEIIRQTRMKRHHAILWTCIQIVIFWSVFLWILPMGILELQQGLGIPVFEHPGQWTGAVILFLSASLLGLSSGWAMSSRGSGTPLPTATAAELVLAGPYRLVRNPMALAGIVQGLAVGWSMGSVMVLAYAIAGGFVWHFVARPVEEADLVERFGAAYENYRQQVPLWRPTLRPFKQD